MSFRFFKIFSLILFPGLCAFYPASAQNPTPNKFNQLYDAYATPNIYRNAAGAPGHAYYQQKADYEISVILDDKTQTLNGEETITYHNNSPDVLTYLWLQLDQNMRAKDSDTWKVRSGNIDRGASLRELRDLEPWFDGGFKLSSVTDKAGKALPYTVNKTMMRIDLPTALKPGGSYSFQVKWWYNINDREKIGGRSGYEYFPGEDNYLYTIAQFFPRMAVYNDVEGWQNKQFLGRGEFALPFGDYKVSITVPEDHILGATGVLTNAKDVLTAPQRERFELAKTAAEPVMIVTEAEAREKELNKAEKLKTWVFRAENVRDFAFASSRKFIWDAIGVKFGDRTVMAMSYYPKEGNPLWEQYSTKVVAHTIRSYSSHSFDYPYPAAISVHTKEIGMEYPMICFNGGRPETDGTYTERTKYGMISVIIHEVGHNYFPMIVNSDERQWTWMDEGLNSFLQYLAEKEFDRDYPSRRGPAMNIVDYMKGDKANIAPIMVNSESILQFGNNAYGKPATALNILRETIMGRELFDFAFKEYCQRWMFKHPSPEDLFRTLEDASAVDLDWFWRGWFYTTDHVDISLENVKWFKLNTADPVVEADFQRDKENNKGAYITDIRNKTAIPKSQTELDPKLLDFYSNYDPLEPDYLDKEAYKRLLSRLNEEEKAVLSAGKNYYELSFRNVGGLVMPVILEFTYSDGSREVFRIPAEIWRQNSEAVSKVFACEKEIRSIQMDPFLETADTETGNNAWPPKPEPSRFELFLDRETGENPMQREKRAREKE